MLDACTRPDLIVEITMQPVRRYGVDAAILFSDIVVPLRAIGVDVDIVPSVGPVVADPIGSDRDLARLPPLEPDDVPYVDTSVRALVEELAGTPLIGFAGAPFTLASYLIEGGPSKNHEMTKALMHREPRLWHALLDRLATITAEFLLVQIRAGASAIQLFDSWAGFLSRADYERHVLPHSRTVLERVRAAAPHVPRIHFGVNTGEFLDLLASAGAEILGVDWRVPLDVATRRAPGVVLQGNLDPALLGAGEAVLTSATQEVLTAGRAAPGHVFNLGHGVLPDTDPETLAHVVRVVQQRAD